MNFDKKTILSATTVILLAIAVAGFFNTSQTASPVQLTNEKPHTLITAVTTPKPTSTPALAPTPISTPYVPVVLPAITPPTTSGATCNSNGGVTINSDKTTCKNNKKIFPQLMYFLCSQGQSVSGCQANIALWKGTIDFDVVGFSIPAAAYSGTTTMFMPNMGGESLFTNNPSFAGVIQGDEPNNNPANIPAMKVKYDAFKLAYPNKIVVTGDYRYFGNLEPLTDVMMSDFYPYTDRSWITGQAARKDIIYFYEYVTNRDIYQKPVEQFRKPIWNIMSGVATLNDGNVYPITLPELRVMAYTSITMNTNGLAYYSYATSGAPGWEFSSLNKDQALTQHYINFAQEIKSLNDILILPTKDNSWQFKKGNMVTFGSPLTGTWNGYQNFNYMLKQSGSTYYLIVVNKDARSVTTTMTIQGLTGVKNAVTLGNPAALSTPGRVIQVTDGKFSDTFPSLGVNIYAIS